MVSEKGKEVRTECEDHKAAGCYQAPAVIFLLGCLIFRFMLRLGALQIFKSIHMSQDQLILLKNKQTGEVYWTRKNKKKVEKKIELSKYSAKLRKHIVFKEAKK